MRRRTLLAAIAGAVVATAFAGGLAWATTGGELHACSKKDNGQLRLVGSAGECMAAEIAVSWNQLGPQGPSGPSGPAGPKGDKGDPGTLGLAGQTCDSGESVTGFDAEGDIVCSSSSPPPPPPPPPPPLPSPSGWTLVPDTGQVNFGTVGVGATSAPRFVTLTNPTPVWGGVGSGALVVLGGTNPTDFTWVDNCTLVPPGGSCQLRVDFRPTAIGLRMALATVVTPLANQVITLNGLGT